MAARAWQQSCLYIYEMSQFFLVLNIALPSMPHALGMHNIPVDQKHHHRYTGKFHMHELGERNFSNWLSSPFTCVIFQNLLLTQG